MVDYAGASLCVVTVIDFDQDTESHLDMVDAAMYEIKRARRDAG